MPTCRFCNATTEPSAAVCPECGQPQAEAAPASSLDSEAARLLRRMIAAGMIELAPRASLDELSERLTRRLDEGPLDATALSDWLIDDDAIDEVFADEAALAGVLGQER
jgi:hypothetical protein